MVLEKFLSIFENVVGDTWVSQLAKHLPLAQIMILGSWDQAPCGGGGSRLSRVSASSSLSAPPTPFVLSLSLKEIKMRS